MKQVKKSFIKVITSRVFIVGIMVLGMFAFMIARLFELQIVEGETYQNDLKTSILRQLSIPASRGNIYDKYGRPLATNDVAYTVKIDNSIKVDEKQKNATYMELVRIIERSGDKVIDELPISIPSVIIRFNLCLMIGLKLIVQFVNRLQDNATFSK